MQETYQIIWILDNFLTVLSNLVDAISSGFQVWKFQVALDEMGKLFSNSKSLFL